MKVTLILKIINVKIKTWRYMKCQNTLKKLKNYIKTTKNQV